MLRKLGFMTRCELQDCIIVTVFHHRSAAIGTRLLPKTALLPVARYMNSPEMTCLRLSEKCWRLRKPHNGTVLPLRSRY